MRNHVNKTARHGIVAHSLWEENLTITMIFKITPISICALCSVTIHTQPSWVTITFKRLFTGSMNAIPIWYTFWTSWTLVSWFTPTFIWSCTMALKYNNSKKFYQRWFLHKAVICFKITIFIIGNQILIFQLTFWQPSVQIGVSQK